MTYRTALPRLLLLLALWMLVTAAACGLIYLETHGYTTHQQESSPRRTRPPRADFRLRF